MKILITVVLLALVAASTTMVRSADGPSKQPLLISPACGSPEEIKALMESQGEKVIFYGSHQVEGVQGKLIKFVTMISHNPKTGSWSQFEAIDSKQICYVDGGTEGTFVPPGIPVIDQDLGNQPSLGVQAQTETVYAVQPKRSSLA